MTRAARFGNETSNASAPLENNIRKEVCLSVYSGEIMMSINGLNSAWNSCFSEPSVIVARSAAEGEVRREKERGRDRGEEGMGKKGARERRGRGR